MIDCEDEEINQGRLSEGQRLSGPMRDSWERGDFWIAYAARINLAIDAIYWNKIDQPFFSPAEGSIDNAWKQRVDLLKDRELAEMEEQATRKLMNMESRVLARDPDDSILALLEPRKVVLITT